MTQRRIQERELTLYSTGRFASRAKARQAAIEQLEREEQKRKAANQVSHIPEFGTPLSFTYTITIP